MNLPSSLLYSAGMGNWKLLEGQFLENQNLAGQSIESEKKGHSKYAF
jgi:hypothetical protein